MAAVDCWPNDHSEQWRLLQADRDWWITQYEQAVQELTSEKDKRSEDDVRQRYEAMNANESGHSRGSIDVYKAKVAENEAERERLAREHEGQLSMLREKLRAKEEEVAGLMNKREKDQLRWKEEAEQLKNSYELQYQTRTSSKTPLQQE